MDGERERRKETEVCGWDEKSSVQEGCSLGNHQGRGRGQMREGNKVCR